MSARIGSLILGVAGARGVDTRALAAATGFDPALASDPDARIPVDVENALWDAAARATGDPLFGLHAAQAVTRGAFDVLDYAVRTAPTLRTALERLVRYNRLFHSHAAFTLEEHGDLVRIEHAFLAPGRAPARHATDFTLASIVVLGAQLIDAPVIPVAVDLPHPVGDVAAYAAVFGVAPAFGRARGALVLPRAPLARPCPAADAARSQVIVRHAEDLLSALPDPSDSFASRLRRLISAQLASGGATLTAAAHALKLSERSLQRRLADDGVTFDAIVEEVRRELALRYLADPALAIGEIAYLLGYSEPSAFHRAFKRWTGQTPAQARRRPT